MAQPKGPEKTRQLRLITQQREGLWAKRRRELAGYTYGRPHHGSREPQDSKVTGHSDVIDSTDPDPLDDLESMVDSEFGTPTPQKTPEQQRRSEAMKAHWVRRKAKAAEAVS